MLATSPRVLLQSISTTFARGSRAWAKQRTLGRTTGRSPLVTLSLCNRRSVRIRVRIIATLTGTGARQEQGFSFRLSPIEFYHRVKQQRWNNATLPAFEKTRESLKPTELAIFQFGGRAHERSGPYRMARRTTLSPLAIMWILTSHRIV